MGDCRKRQEGGFCDNYSECVRHLASARTKLIRVCRNIASVVEASIDVELTFHEKKRGAYLAMHQAQTMEIPKDTILSKLSRVKKLQRHNRYLVTKIVRCPAYALHLSDQGIMPPRIAYCM